MVWGGPCGSQSLWCLPLSSPPYILDNLPCSLVGLASKPQRSTCLPQHYDYKHLKSLRPSHPSTSCAFCITKTMSIWRSRRKWELGADVWPSHFSSQEGTVMATLLLLLLWTQLPANRCIPLPWLPDEAFSSFAWYFRLRTARAKVKMEESALQQSIRRAKKSRRIIVTAVLG